jgi:thiol-disulfide isomerase/thioredoxin
MSLSQTLQRHKGKVVPLLLIALIGYMWFRPPAWVQDMDEPLPPVAFSTLDGRVGSLDNLRGKVVLVNFWATWCPYCRHEMPAMQEFYRDYEKKGFEIIAFSTDDEAGKVRDFLRENGYTFPAAMAGDDQRRAFGDVSQLPTSFIIDRDGKLRYKIHGQVHYGRLEGLVEPLLKAH